MAAKPELWKHKILKSWRESHRDGDTESEPQSRCLVLVLPRFFSTVSWSRGGGVAETESRSIKARRRIQDRAARVAENQKLCDDSGSVVADLWSDRGEDNSLGPECLMRVSGGGSV